MCQPKRRSIARGVARLGFGFEIAVVTKSVVLMLINAIDTSNSTPYLYPTIF
jgi:hypothetical protein